MKDLLFNTAGHLTEIGESTRAHQRDLLLLEKGWDKASPIMGVGLGSLRDDEISPLEIKSRIVNMFRRDGMRVNRIDINGSNITTDANY